MRARKTLLILAGLGALGLAAGVGYWAGVERQERAPLALAGPGQPPAPQPAAQAQDERNVLYWYDPMYPQHKFDKSGKSPFMDMQLVPRYADEEDGGGSVRISPSVAQNLGVRTALVEEGVSSRRVDTVGTVQADERRISVVQSRAAGYVERLYVRAVNDPVRRGQLVAEVYAPELLAAQEEYAFLHARVQDDPELARAARERLSLLGVPEAQIQRLERGLPPQRRVALHAPASGVVTELAVREGAAVSPGMPMAMLVDLSAVWIVAEVPEAQISWVSVGKPVEASVSAFPGERFEGRVEYVYPEVNAATRTVKVRCALANPKLKLKPGMVAQVGIQGSEKRTLMVPTDAVIHTGTRTVVIVAEAEGRYRPAEVQTGFESGEATEILSGLAKGERVVVSGQFLIDSEANLKGVIARLSAADESQAATPAEPGRGAVGQIAHRAQGNIEEIDDAAGRVVIAHGPVPSLDWPAMTMGFAVADKAMLAALKPGQPVDFEFNQGEGGDWMIRRIAPSR